MLLYVHSFVLSISFCPSNCLQFLFFYLLVMSSLAEPLTMHRGAQGSEELRLGLLLYGNNNLSAIKLDLLIKLTPLKLKYNDYYRICIKHFNH